MPTLEFDRDHSGAKNSRLPEVGNDLPDTVLQRDLQVQPQFLLCPGDIRHIPGRGTVSRGEDDGDLRGKGGIVPPLPGAVSTGSDARSARDGQWRGNGILRSSVKQCFPVL